MNLRNVQNQRRGAAFENFFEYTARRDGLMAVRNGQAVRWLPNGKLLAIKSNLDWSVLNDSGRAAFVDTKTFQKDAFTFSMIDSRQLELSMEYHKRHFVSGFVVYFRESGRINYYSGPCIEDAGPRSRFTPSEGAALGTLHAFSLHPLFT